MALEITKNDIETTNGAELNDNELKKINALSVELLETDTKNTKDGKLDRNEIKKTKLDKSIKEKLEKINLSSIKKNTETKVNNFLKKDIGSNILSVCKSDIDSNISNFESVKTLSDVKKDQFATYIAKGIIASIWKKGEIKLYTNNEGKHIKLKEISGGKKFDNKKNFYKFFGQPKIKELRKKIYYSLDPKNEIKNFVDMLTGDKTDTLGIDNKTNNLGIDKNLYAKNTPEKQTKTIIWEDNQKNMEISLLASGMDFGSDNPTNIILKTEDKNGNKIEIKGRTYKGAKGIIFSGDFPNGISYDNGIFNIDGNIVGRNPIDITMKSASVQNKNNPNKKNYDEVNLSISTNGEILQPDMNIIGGFEVNRFEINEEIKNKIDTIYIQKYLKTNPNKELYIEGYASIDGDYNNNKILSQNRADAVRNYLIEQGIDGNRIVSIGHGETEKFGKKEDNRRIVMKFK